MSENHYKADYQRIVKLRGELDALCAHYGVIVESAGMEHRQERKALSSNLRWARDYLQDALKDLAFLLIEEGDDG